MSDKPRYFAVLEAAYRDPTLPTGTPGAYERLDRDDPKANEFRIQINKAGGGTNIPAGIDREKAIWQVELYNQAFEAAIEIHKNKANILVGRTGYLNRDEKDIP